MYNTKKQKKSEEIQLLYENAIRYSENQDDRKKEIDNKTNYLITIAIILLGILIEFVDISKAVNETQNIMTTIFVCNAYYITVIISVIVLGLYMYIFLGKDYKSINPQMLVNENTRLMTKEELQNELTEKYVKVSKINAQLNDKQMKIFNITTYILALEIIMVLLIFVIIKMIG